LSTSNQQLPTPKAHPTVNSQETSKKEIKALEFTWKLAVGRALDFGTWVVEIVVACPVLHMITHHA
jgi:hypothetical protein